MMRWEGAYSREGRSTRGPGVESHESCMGSMHDRPCIGALHAQVAVEALSGPELDHSLLEGKWRLDYTSAADVVSA
jgi:hypothetical protein